MGDVVHGGRDFSKKNSRSIEDNERKVKETKSKELKSNEIKRYLFTTKTCPNCKLVKKMLNENNIDYEIVDAQVDNQMVDQFAVLHAPTLIVCDEQTSEKYDSLPKIKEYIEALSSDINL